VKRCSRRVLPETLHYGAELLALTIVNCLEGESGCQPI
jgi:hypothetical protein